METFDYPSTWLQDDKVEEKEFSVITALSEYFEQNGVELAAIIIEPLVQGAGGMQMCSLRFLQKLDALAKVHGILIIYDEVMTWFGRTGADFTCVKAGAQPDIICFGKGITGGFLPLVATPCTESIYSAFLDNKISHAFLYVHSYTAYPLGCAAALASFNY